ETQPTQAQVAAQATPTLRLEKGLSDWVAEAPLVHSTMAGMEETYHKSLIDLAALRFRGRLMPEALPAAGLPWFMTVFGRDSLLTSFQAMPFVPQLARAS